MGCLVVASAGFMPGIKRRIRCAVALYNRFIRGLYDMEDAPFALKVRMPKVEVVETLAVRVCDVDPWPRALR